MCVCVFFLYWIDLTSFPGGFKLSLQVLFLCVRILGLEIDRRCLFEADRLYPRPDLPAIREPYSSETARDDSGALDPHEEARTAGFVPHFRIRRPVGTVERSGRC